MDKNLSVQDSIFLACGFALLIWAIKLAESLFGVSLSHLGVYPHTASGLFGVITAPLIHGSLQHVFANTLPILLLGSMLNYGLNGDKDDGVILGASSMHHFEQNLESMGQGPLPDSVVDTLNEAWELTRSQCVKYFRP